MPAQTRRRTRDDGQSADFQLISLGNHTHRSEEKRTITLSPSHSLRDPVKTT